MTSPRPAVRRRHVLYLSGFDPRGPKLYHALYRDQAPKQAALAGATVAVGPRRAAPGGGSLWQVEAALDGATVETRYEFLRWDDIIRGHWIKSDLRLVQAILRCFAAFSRAGVIRRARQESRAVWLGLLFPGLTLLGFLLPAALLLAGLGWLLAGPVGLPWWAALPLALAPAPLLRRLWRHLEEKHHACWLTRVHAFLLAWSRGEVPELEPRIEAFADRLAAVMQEEVDEVLLVGHSVGSQLAVSVLARALQRHPGLAEGGPRLSLLTLGQCISLLMLLPGAEQLRRDTAAAAASSVPWIDITAPTDPASTGQIDILAFTGRARPQGPDARPLQRSPRFHKLMTPQSFRRIRRSPMDFHFQYLMAAEVPGAYDFFRITAGPGLLEAPPAAGG